MAEFLTPQMQALVTDTGTLRYFAQAPPITQQGQDFRFVASRLVQALADEIEFLHEHAADLEHMI